jgi:hypothetical protein
MSAIVEDNGKNIGSLVDLRGMSWLNAMEGLIFGVAVKRTK